MSGKFKLKLKLPPRPALPGSDAAPEAESSVPSQLIHQPVVTVPLQQDKKRKQPEESALNGPADQSLPPSKRANLDTNSADISQKTSLNGGAAHVPIIRKITLKRPASTSAPSGPVSNSAQQIAQEVFKQVEVTAEYRAPGVDVKVQKQMEKQQEKLAKEQQRQLAKDERQRTKAAAEEAKLRQKNEVAQEKLRAKQEAEQEKKRAVDQANIVKRITLKLVHGSGGSASAKPAMPPPAAPAAAAAATPAAAPKMQMAPSNMFLSSTASPKRGAGALGKLKPKVKPGAVGGAKGPRPGGAVAKVPPAAAGAPAGAAAADDKPRNGPSDKATLEKILSKIQAKDLRKIFWKPVTDALAPNYSAVIKQPMDFATMRQKLADGHYKTWDDMEADLDLMFNNCMTYNPQGTIYHMEGKKMQEVARRLVELGRRGETNFRGRTAKIVKSHNAVIQAEMHRQHATEAQPLGRGMRHHGAEGAAAAAGPGPAASRAAAAAAAVLHPSGPRNAAGAPNFHLLHFGHAAKTGRAGRAKGGGISMLRRPSAINPLLLVDSAMEGDVRLTYRPRVTAPQVPFAAWGALANGVSAEGLSWAHGRPLVAPTLPDVASAPDAYVSSVSRFVSRCSPALRRLVTARALICVPVEGAPLPPEPTPAPAPAPAAPPRALPPAAPKPSLGGFASAPGATAAPALRPPLAGAAPAGAGGVSPLNLNPSAITQPLPSTVEYLKQALSVLKGSNSAQAQAIAALLMQQSTAKPGTQPLSAQGNVGKMANDALAFLLQQQQLQQNQQQQQQSAQQRPQQPNNAALAQQQPRQQSVQQQQQQLQQAANMLQQAVPQRAVQQQPQQQQQQPQQNMAWPQQQVHQQQQQQPNMTWPQQPQQQQQQQAQQPSMTWPQQPQQQQQQQQPVVWPQQQQQANTAWQQQQASMVMQQQQQQQRIQQQQQQQLNAQMAASQPQQGMPFQQLQGHPQHATAPFNPQQQQQQAHSSQVRMMPAAQAAPQQQQQQQAAAPLRMMPAAQAALPPQQQQQQPAAGPVRMMPAAQASQQQTAAPVRMMPAAQQPMLQQQQPMLQQQQQQLHGMPQLQTQPAAAPVHMMPAQMVPAGQPMQQQQHAARPPPGMVPAAADLPELPAATP